MPAVTSRHPTAAPALRARRGCLRFALRMGPVAARQFPRLSHHTGLASLAVAPAGLVLIAPQADELARGQLKVCKVGRRSVQSADRALWPCAMHAASLWSEGCGASLTRPQSQVGAQARQCPSLLAKGVCTVMDQEWAAPRGCESPSGRLCQEISGRLKRSAAQAMGGWRGWGAVGWVGVGVGGFHLLRQRAKVCDVLRLKGFKGVHAWLLVARI